MIRNNIPRNCWVVIDEKPFDYAGHVDGRMQLPDPAGGASFALPDEHGVMRPITDAQFEELLATGRASIVTKPSVDPVRRQNDVSQWVLAQATAIDPKAGKRLAQSEALDAAGVPNGRKAIGQWLARNWAGKLQDQWGDHDPPATIERWRRERGSPGARAARQMVSMTGKVARAPYQADVPEEICEKHVLAKFAGRSRISSRYAAFSAELDRVNEGSHPDYDRPDAPYPTISYDTFRRRCYALENIPTVEAEQGRAAVEQRFKGGGRGLRADYAMQRVIIDHTRLDLVVVHVLPDGEEVVVGRPWLTLAVDVATRAVVASLITFIPPCAWTVSEILRRMAMRKAVPADLAARYPILAQIRGKPVEIVVDNGSELRSHAIEAAARGAKLAVRFCPVKRPRYRAVGERAFQTIQPLICDDLPGRVIPIAQARLHDYDPARDAVVTMEDLEPIETRAVCLYNTSPHDGLDGRQPALMFQRDAARNGINNFADLDALRRETMEIVSGVQVSGQGVVLFNGMRFHDYLKVPELLNDLVPVECRRRRRAAATATVDVRFDPMDISRIHVWNRVSRTYVELRCTDPRYADGLPLFVHEMILDQAKRDAAGFNSEKERLAARDRLLQIKLDVDPNARLRLREEMKRLHEVPRIRRMTGRIANLELRPPEPIEGVEEVPFAAPAPTGFDQEVLSPRPAPKPARTPRRRRDPRDAGSPREASEAVAAPALKRRAPRSARS